MRRVDAIMLEFQPLVFRRTMAHELFFMSTSTFEAARVTPYPPLEGRLAGESFELMIKAMMAVITGPSGKLPTGHDIGCCFQQGAEFEVDARKAVHGMITDLWPEWGHVEQMIEEDINPPQARYGASASWTPKHGKRPIAGATHRTTGTWIEEMDDLYRELRASVGRMIWTNWPEEATAQGDGAKRRITTRPALAPGAKLTASYPDLHPSTCCLLLSANHREATIPDGEERSR